MDYLSSLNAKKKKKKEDDWFQAYDIIKKDQRSVVQRGSNFSIIQ